ncbi:MAG TPA: hypothetical protein VG095_04685, partial [Chthoniobacterales bacterium]|nr:hypothetical protein [Chthoniobacterales bacterium]
GKSGGDINSRALVTLPLTLAAVVALNALAKGARWWLGHTAVLAAAFVVALAVGIELRKFATRKMPVLLEAYTMIASEPGRWYFPFDPLAHLLVENKFRPNIDVVHCYAAAGRPVDAGVFRSLMPEDLRQIAVPPPIASWGMRELQRILPEYSRTSRERDLPQHQVIFRH